MDTHQTPNSLANFARSHWPWQALQQQSVAMAIATQAHHMQQRKDGSPFLLHPIAVWQTLLHVELADADIQALALLHDVLEERAQDADFFEQLIATELGAPMALAVRWLSDKPGRSTAQRKRDQLRKFRHAPWAVRVVKLADRLSNLQSGPAPSWDVVKTASYVKHTQDLLDVLRGSHAELEFYIRRTLQQPMWQPVMAELSNEV